MQYKIKNRLIFRNYTSTRFGSQLKRPVHTKNYKYNFINVHNSGRYRLCILSTSSSVALDSQAGYSSFLSFISRKKIILKVIPTISFLFAFIVIDVVWTAIIFNIENDF